MKLLAKQVRNGVKDGKPWEMASMYVQTETGNVHEIVMFNSGTFPDVQAGDTVEPIFDLITETIRNRKTVVGKVIGFKKIKA